MSRTITFHFSGNCPYTNSKQTIDLDYFEINMVGNMTPGYKRAITLVLIPRNVRTLSKILMVVALCICLHRTNHTNFSFESFNSDSSNNGCIVVNQS